VTQIASEFDLIADIWGPLTRGNAGAYALRDDVALVPASPHGHVVTCDQVIEGTHFLPSDGLDWVAKRLVRRNLSDLIAKGCRPIGAFLALAWPQMRPQTEMKAFAQGLGEDLAHLAGNCPLLGGDTSSTQGPLVASLTLIGTPLAPSGQPVLRRGAQPGDVIFMTGTLGDPYLGLQVRLGQLDGEGLSQAQLISLAPAPPPLSMATWIGAFATASIDVSDGLLADAGHVASASGTALVLELDRLPLSMEATHWLHRRQEDVSALLKLATGGDDYQSFFTVPPAQADAFMAQCHQSGVRLTQIGLCQEGVGLRLMYRGQTVALPSRTGWQFSDA